MTSVPQATFRRKNKQAIFAISDAGYATMALTMFDSVTKFYKDSDFYLFIVGTGTTRLIDGNIHVIYIDEVMDDLDLSQRLLHYLQVELVTSVRPHCVEHLFAEGYERAIYLDPDIIVFRRMTEVDELLDGDCNGVVTPHALHSISDGELEGGDNVFLKCGIFNMGFFALKNTAETRRMIAWWKDKLKWKCTVDWPNGYFVDQKWLEFLPVYFEGFHILRLPTYNLAPWNAEHYKILADGYGRFYINDYRTPIAFIHYSGIRRMELHFKYMIEARSYYLKQLEKRKFQRLDFVNYEVRFKANGFPFDKVCTFIYKDYVKKTKDQTSNPLVDRWFYEYLHSTDAETGFPIYIRKLYEIMPSIFVGYLSTKLEITWDNMIWLVQHHFNYDSVVSLETMIQLRNENSPPDFEIKNINATSNSYAPAVQSLLNKRKRDVTDTSRPDREIITKADRIEVRSGDVTVCIPNLTESGDLPPGMNLDPRDYAEIWVPSVTTKEKFIKDHGILNVTPILQPVVTPAYRLEETELPERKFIVMLCHDFDLGFADQDTLASIHAFKAAFEDDDDVLLLCYLTNSNISAEMRSIKSAAGVSNISIAKGSYGSGHYYSHLHRANCFISLHQNASFGYRIAEAMSLGKDVIATDRGGSSHYMNSDNSFIVRSDSAAGVLRQSSEYLAQIRDEFNVLGSKSNKAKFYVRKNLSPSVVGLAMESRLKDLAKLHCKKDAPYLPKASRFTRAVRGIRNKIRPPKTPIALPPAVQLPSSNQTDAIIQILLRNVMRPDVME